MTTRGGPAAYTSVTGNERQSSHLATAPRAKSLATANPYPRSVLWRTLSISLHPKSADVVGSAKSFLAALLLIVVWSMAGPYFGWSDGHELLINTVTTVVTFLMAFLIQHTQNRDTRALHLKIDELLKATRGARNSMIDLDRLSDQQLMRLEAEFKRICRSDEESGTDADPDGLAPESA